MLQFASPLTPVATDLLRAALEICADLSRAETPADEWPMSFPLSARCLTQERARGALLDLLDKLHLPQMYVPTTYHWLLLYECLHFYIELVNDDPWSDLVERFKALRDVRDAAYLDFPLDLQGVEGVTVYFEAFLDLYFWDTDFLLDPSTYYGLDAPAKQQLGYRADLFGVLSGLQPHPAELELKRADEVGPTGPEREADNDEPNRGHHGR